MQMHAFLDPIFDKTYDHKSYKGSFLFRGARLCNDVLLDTILGRLSGTQGKNNCLKNTQRSGGGGRVFREVDGARDP